VFRIFNPQNNLNFKNMKKVSLECTYTIFCSAVVEVPDDFEFESYEPDKRIDELESILNVSIDSIIPEPEVKDHESINDLSFDEWHEVDVD
jgi:hypothetical protein